MIRGGDYKIHFVSIMLAILVKYFHYAYINPHL